MTEPTIQIHLKEVPTSPLTPLDIEKKDSPVDGLDYEVVFEGEVVGTLAASIAWRNQTLRWHDVQSVKPQKKRKREELPSHEKSLMLLSKCVENSSKIVKPQYWKHPFEYGCDSIQDLAMIGGPNFEHSMQLYNHWFNVPPLQRLEREIRNFDPTKLTTDELKDTEKKLKQLWVRSHGVLMKRLS